MAGVLLALVVPAGAAAASGDELVTTWDGPSVDLAWDGPPATASSATFSGAPVVVPGGVQGRTITVTNAGPTDAVLRGWVQDVQLLDPDAPEADLPDGPPEVDFYADLTLTWRTASGDGHSSFRRLATAGATPVVDVLLARGASTEVTVVTALATDATSGNRANVAPREATYEVVLRLDGSTWARAAATSPSGPAGTGVDAVTPQADTIVTIAEVQAAGGAGAGPLAHTVLHGLRAALVAVVAIGTGSMLLGGARRRRDARREAGRLPVAPSVDGANGAGPGAPGPAGRPREPHGCGAPPSAG
ncbi:hypothetical protein [Cellulomonas wangsupingiae]|uniref:hypothetical protein n=1 Tax=Cellulomonas wangsupingiae TaxID=2968085 RepID=UPI001D0EAD25|nr:hypothetical protein [Cellulomonas wangsupingiae]MCM0639756.1 hypothetical protein [Cellulomonas wangsupingiae]